MNINASYTRILGLKVFVYYSINEPTVFRSMNHCWSMVANQQRENHNVISFYERMWGGIHFMKSNLVFISSVSKNANASETRLYLLAHKEVVDSKVLLNF